MVDWKGLEVLDNKYRENMPEVFDVSPDNLYGFELNPDLTDEEVEDALFWKRFMRGQWLVTGGVGAGKGAFAIMVAYKMKRYFGKTPILDYRPCAPFGYYEFFDTKLFITEVQKMAKSAKITLHESGNKNDSLKVAEDFAESWVNEQRKILRNSTLVLDEFTRYMDRRRPHNPIGILLSHIFTIWRHLGILILGLATDLDYLDKRAFKELSMKVECTWSQTRPMTSYVLLKPVKYVGSVGVIGRAGKEHLLEVKLDKPQPMLNGLGWKDLYNTENDVALSVPRSLSRMEQ